jgi:hypothetical protein
MWQCWSLSPGDDMARHHGPHRVATAGAGAEPFERHRQVDVVGDVALAHRQDGLRPLGPRLHIGPNLEGRLQPGAELRDLGMALAYVLEGLAVHFRIMRQIAAAADNE